MSASRRQHSNRPPEGWRSVQVWMPAKLHDALRHLAIDRRSNVSQILRDLAEDAVMDRLKLWDGHGVTYRWTEDESGHPRLGSWNTVGWNECTGPPSELRRCRNKVVVSLGNRAPRQEALVRGSQRLVEWAPLDEAGQTILDQAQPIEGNIDQVLRMWEQSRGLRVWLEAKSPLATQPL